MVLGGSLHPFISIDYQPKGQTRLYQDTYIQDSVVDARGEEKRVY
jgi:polysaccharide pyruvyl transferase WcaK-like protein